MIDTNDPSLRSFIRVEPESHFPIQNLPLGVFRRHSQTPRIGAAIGDNIVDLSLLDRENLLPSLTLLDRLSLNAFMNAGRPMWRAVRQRLSELLRHDEPRLRDDTDLRRAAFVPMADVEMLMPFEIGDYTDFYSSRDHATTVGAMLRGPDNALMPNWLHLPVAYHGRASSVVISGTDLRRPWGQTLAANATAPTFEPSRAVDFELEMGLVIGTGNLLGAPVPIRRAEEHCFGVVLVNDWSARDIQKWEYVPLGPFLAKNFGTSISPWVVSLDALEPFRVAGPVQDPPPLPYLRTSGISAFNVDLAVALQTKQMDRPEKIATTNLRHLYWSFAQQVAHHTVNGCNLQPGDLLATGTISGPAADARGCLLERTLGGKQPLVLRNGEQRKYLEDGDRVTMTGWCQGPDYRVGFGEVTGQLLPALAPETFDQ